MITRFHDRSDFTARLAALFRTLLQLPWTRDTDDEPGAPALILVYSFSHAHVLGGRRTPRWPDIDADEPSLRDACNKCLER